MARIAYLDHRGFFCTIDMEPSEEKHNSPACQGLHAFALLLGLTWLDAFTVSV
jgi:hypothetical protein